MKGIGEGGSLGKGVDKKRERDMIVISSATIVHNISWLYLRSSHSFFHYYSDSDLSLFLRRHCTLFLCCGETVPRIRHCNVMEVCARCGR